MDSDYYYCNPGSEKVGPLDEETFFGSASAGLISAGAVVWRSGEADWRAWADVAAAWTSARGNAASPETSDEPEELISADVGTESVFSDAWTIFKKHWGKFVLVGLIAWASMLFSCTSDLVGEYSSARLGGTSVVGNVGAADFAGAGTSEEEEEASAAGFSDDGGGEPRVVLTETRSVFGAAGAAPSAVSLLLSVVLCIFSFGFLKIVRKEDAGTPVSFGDLFPLGRCLRKLLKFIGLGLVFFAAAGALGGGVCLPLFLSDATALLITVCADVVLLCAIFVLGPRFAFAFNFLFEADCGVFESLRASWRITRGRFWRTLGFFILFYLIAFFGITFTLGFGAIVLYPLFALWLYVYYVKLCKTTDADVPASVLALK